MLLSSARTLQAAPAAPARARAAPRLPPSAVHRGGDRSIADPLSILVHGRHVDVTPEMDADVRARLSAVLGKFRGAEILESEGGVAAVDVRLMNSQAEVKLQPRIHNRAVQAQEAYVRQGELKVTEAGNGWSESLDNALAALDRKLTKYTKPAPKKVDYRKGH